MNSSNLPEHSDINNQLRQQLATVLAAPIQSAARAKAMSHLLRLLRQLPGIRVVNHQDYLLALNQTWEWMSRNIDEFQSSTDSLADDFVKWINGYLYWRIHDIYRHPERQQHLSLDEEIFDNGETYLDTLSALGYLGCSLNTLDAHIQVLQQQENREIATQIEAWIALDPDRQLETCYPRDRNRCHCQLLSSRVILKDPPDSFTQIARDLNIPYQTLVSHWKRSCLPILQAQAQKLGYKSSENI
jgi:hypothetical protein